MSALAIPLMRSAFDYFWQQREYRLFIDLPMTSVMLRHYSANDVTASASTSRPSAHAQDRHCFRTEGVLALYGSGQQQRRLQCFREVKSSFGAFEALST